MQWDQGLKATDKKMWLEDGRGKEGYRPRQLPKPLKALKRGAG
jgi:hypothetical protein